MRGQSQAVSIVFPFYNGLFLTLTPRELSIGVSALSERQLTRDLPSTHQRQIIVFATAAALGSIFEHGVDGEWVQMLQALAFFFTPGSGHRLIILALLCGCAVRFARRFVVACGRGGHGECISRWPIAQLNALLLQFHLQQLVLLLDLFLLTYYLIELIADGLIALLFILQFIA